MTMNKLLKLDWKPQFEHCKTMGKLESAIPLAFWHDSNVSIKSARQNIITIIVIFVFI